MTPAEFPKIEQVLIPERKETFEKELPYVLTAVAADVLAREVQTRFLFYSQTGDPDLLSDLRRLNEMDKKELAERMAGVVKEGNVLETIALLDLGEREYELMAASQSAALSLAEEDSEEAEGLEKSIGFYRNRQEKMRLMRDWLLEDAPELREFAKEDDFKEWVERSLKSHEVHLRSKALRENPEAAQNLRTQYEALSKVLAGSPLSQDEMDALVSLLTLEINRTRILTSQEIGNYALAKEEYNRAALLRQEKEILKIRQFLVNIYGGEWVKMIKKK